MKLRFQIYVKEHEMIRGKHQQRHVMMKENTCKTHISLLRYVNIKILLEIHAYTHWKHTENVMNAVLNLKTSANLLLQRIC